MQSLLQQFINNQWQPSHGQRQLAVINPYTEERIAEVTAGHPTDVDDAVKAARRALPGWSQKTGAERAGYLEKIADGLHNRRADLSQLSSINNGKILEEAQFDLDDAIACYRYYAEQARDLDQRQGLPVTLAMQGVQAHSYQDPVGVVGLITPWNFPLVTSAWKLAPALAAGCTAILKPSEVTPLPELILAEIITEAELPAGVFNLLFGDGEGIGAPMSSHKGIDKISFTGSNRVGEAIMAAAAPGNRSVSLELGGKSPILVLADADMDEAVEYVMAGIFFNAGQICSATSRLLMHESLADSLYQTLGQRIDALRLGDPLAAGTDMGPLTSARQRDIVLNYLAQADSEGLTPVRDGRRQSLPKQGLFMAPSLFRDVPVTSRLWQEEIFGPVLCGRSFSDDDEAVALANDSDFGLAATVISGDASRARRIGKQLQAGTIWYNSPQIVLPETSWGGFKRSGIGRELGPWGLSAYLEVKHMVGPII